MPPAKKTVENVVVAPEPLTLEQSFLKKAVEVLSAPLPGAAIKSRKGGGGVSLRYIEGHTAIRRVLEATGGAYTWEIVDYQILPYIPTASGTSQQLVVVKGRLTIAGHSVEDIGVQVVNERGGEDLFKGAVTDAFKRCARYFGLANELYGDDYDKQAEEAKSADDMKQAKKRLMQLYKEQTGNALGPEEANALTAQKFGKTMAEVTYEELLVLLSEYELKEATPF